MIDPSTHLAAMIRAQFAAQFRARAKGRPMGGRDARAVPGESSAPPHANGEAAPTATSSSEDARIQQMVALRVRALSPDDPQRQRKAFRIFLESILLQTFGRERLDDRSFDEVVDVVLQRMEDDPHLKAALQEAGSQLLADAGPSSPR